MAQLERHLFWGILFVEVGVVLVPVVPVEGVVVGKEERPLYTYSRPTTIQSRSRRVLLKCTWKHKIDL